MKECGKKKLAHKRWTWKKALYWDFTLSVYQKWSKSNDCQQTHDRLSIKDGESLAEQHLFTSILWDHMKCKWVWPKPSCQQLLISHHSSPLQWQHWSLCLPSLHTSLYGFNNGQKLKVTRNWGTVNEVPYSYKYKHKCQLYMTFTDAGLLITIEVGLNKKSVKSEYSFGQNSIVTYAFSWALR